MAPANQPSSKVSAIDARMTPSGSGSVAPAAKIAKKKNAKKRTRTSDKVPSVNPQMIPWASLTVAQAEKIAKKKNAKKRTRSSDKVPSVNPQKIPWASLTVAQAEKIIQKRKRVRYTKGANGKVHVDFNPSTGNPIGPNGMQFSLMLGTIVSIHAPVNVGKWDDIPVEQVRPLIKRALRMFDVDISKKHIQDWIIWRMKLRFECIQEEAREGVQNPDMMEIISKLGSSKF